MGVNVTIGQILLLILIILAAIVSIHTFVAFSRYSGWGFHGIITYLTVGSILLLIFSTAQVIWCALFWMKKQTYTHWHNVNGLCALVYLAVTIMFFASGWASGHESSLGASITSFSLINFVATCCVMLYFYKNAGQL